jgi:hypothetical protein
MLEILEDRDDLISVGMTGPVTKADYDMFYRKLVAKTERFGSVRVYEEAEEFGFLSFTSTWIGIWHDLRYGPSIRLEAAAIVSDSVWARLLVSLWRGIDRIWPVSASGVRCFALADRERAKRWLDEWAPKPSRL